MLIETERWTIRRRPKGSYTTEEVELLLKWDEKSHKATWLWLSEQELKELGAAIQAYFIDIRDHGETADTLG